MLKITCCSLQGSANVCWLALALVGWWSLPVRSQESLLLHLPLEHNAEDKSAHSHAVSGSGIKFNGEVSKSAQSPLPIKKFATFSGRDSRLEIKPGLELADKPFEISLWVNADDLDNQQGGDLVSQYDPSLRTGFHLGIYTHAGVTNSQPNTRQLHFGIDQGVLEKQFTDHGRLGKAVYVFAMCVHDGHLYASTCCADPQESGHVFRFEGGDRWTDLGSPDKANAISAMAVYGGKLYVASSKYRLAGSSLAESENPNLGGRIFRLSGSSEHAIWEPCGRLSEQTEAVASLIVFQGQLYASSLYKPAGFFRYEGEQVWTPCALPGTSPETKRVEAMLVNHEGLFATSYDEGSIFRYDGQKWHDAGRLPEATQTYGLTMYQGQLHVSEWPKAHVYRYGGGTTWHDIGKMGQELEAMPLIVYNGKLYGGSLPLAQVYRYDGNQQWTLIDRVDSTPDVKYRRAWSMAIYQGRLFVGTLPSGRVQSIQAGVNVTWDHYFPAGWHHVRAKRTGQALELFVDQKRVAQTDIPATATINLNGSAPLIVGSGAQQSFVGQLAELRITQ